MSVKMSYRGAQNKNLNLLGVAKEQQNSNGSKKTEIFFKCTMKDTE